jgi:uncharacterized protein
VEATLVVVDFQAVEVRVTLGRFYFFMNIGQTKVGSQHVTDDSTIRAGRNYLLVGAYCLLSLVLLVNPYLSTAQKAVPELWGQHVHDDAHVLKQETIDALEQRLKVYEDSTSNQIAILTILSLDGEALEEYSLKVAEAWKLGQKEKDNGVLLLIAVDDHKMRIEVGHGLEGVLTDAHSNRIIRNELTPNFRKSDFDAGITAGVDAMIKAIGGEYSADDSDESADLTIGQRIGIGLGLFVFLGIFAFFGLIAPGGTGWFLYLFLIPFYALFPIIAVGTTYWYVPVSVYLILFPILRIWIGKSGWGQKISKKMNSGTGKGSGWSSGGWSSGGWSSGGGGSSFSGGGGSFGGGGSSGSW